MSQTTATIESASDKLASAFARLQAAVGNVSERQNSSDDVEAMETSFRRQIESLQSENIQLRDENQALYAQLEKLRQEYDDMQEKNEQIAYQIDRQVEQLELMA